MHRSTRVALLVALAAVPIFALAQRERGAAGSYQVTIGGTSAAVRNLEGGTARADVASEKIGPDHVVHKHLAGVKYEPIRFEVAVGVFQQQIRDALAGRYSRMDGSIDEADYDGDVVRTRTFSHALISEVSFPVLDARSNDPGYVHLEIAPEVTRVQDAVRGQKVAPPAKGRVFQVSSFRFDLQGIDGARVSKIEGLTIKQAVQENAVGEMRDYERVGSALVTPNIRLLVSGATATAFAAWHEDFVVRGNCDQAHEKTGSITFLAGNGDDELLRLDLGGVGIYAMRPSHEDDRAGNWEVELYVETVRLH